jgi:hypothetical protein
MVSHSCWCKCANFYKTGQGPGSLAVEAKVRFGFVEVAGGYVRAGLYQILECCSHERSPVFIFYD